jgi:hypothetical protein
MAVSFLINRSGAHTLTFHYQDIPLAVCFSVLGYVFSNQNLSSYPTFPKHWILRVFLAVTLGAGLYQNIHGTFYYIQSNQPNDKTLQTLESIQRFRKIMRPDCRIWAQTNLAFYFSSEYQIRCLMNASQTLNDSEHNYIIMSRHPEAKWPLDKDYDVLIEDLEREVKNGYRKKLTGFEPLLIFVKDSLHPHPPKVNL